MNLSELRINDLVSFNTIAPAVLGAQFKNVRFLGSFGFEVAKAYPDNIILRARTISPILGNSVNKDYRTYTYYLFKDMNEKTTVLAGEWIQTNTLTVTNTQKIIFTITNPTGTSMKELSDYLLLNGYEFTTSVE